MEAKESKLVAVQDAPHHRLLLEQEGIPFEQISLCEYPSCFFLGFPVEHEHHFLDALWPPGFEVETEVATSNVHESVLLLKPEKLPGYPQSLASRPMGIRRLYDAAKKQ